MGIADRVRGRLSRSAPVPAVAAWAESQPYQGEYTDPKYGDYLATSNDVYSVVSVRAKALAKLPLQTLDAAGVDQPTSDLARLLQHPNPHWTLHRLLKNTELSLGVHGQAHWVMEYGGGRTPREIWPVSSTRMRPIPSRVDFLSGFSYTVPDGSTLRFNPEEVVWFYYPNPEDPLSPLSPLAAARLAADVARESLKANRALFTQGMMGGGFVSPPDKDSTFTEEQAKDLEKLIGRRFQGVEKAHRWTVLRYMLSLSPVNVTPKDAEFVAGMNLTFRQVCRAYGVPPPIVGDAEFATLANLSVYERQLWEQTMTDETSFVESEINRQITPRFPRTAAVAFDVSQVVALQEDENLRWKREGEQLDRGAVTINEWRLAHGMQPVAWGDEPWVRAAVAPISEEKRAVRALGMRLTTLRTVTYERDEEEFAVAWRDLNGRLADSILQRLRQRGLRTIDDVVESPFEEIKWAARTRSATAARFVATTEKSLLLEGRRVGLTAEQIAEAVEGYAIRAAIEAQTQQFATRTIRTTWERVKAELIKGHRRGETVEQMARRVQWVMGVRIDQAAMIARSEVTRAVTTGQLAAYTAAGIIGKAWRTQEDELVRETHAAANGLVAALGENYQVGSGYGPGPGQLGVAEEDINCRCFLEPVTDPARLAHRVWVDADVMALASIADSLGTLNGG